MEGMPTGETMQIIVQWSTNFVITPDMLYIEQEVTNKTLKETNILDLALPKISTKVLHKLQISVAQKI
jgi:hypothetical protein